MRLLAAVVLTVLLAGCSDPVSRRLVPGGANNGTEERIDPRYLPPGQHLYEAFGGGVLTLGASRSDSAPVELPEGVRTLVVNLTLVDGALVRPRANLAGCSWQDDDTWVALGQHIQFGCDAPPPGNGTFTVAHDGTSARLRWSAEGVVRHCVTGSPC